MRADANAAFNAAVNTLLASDNSRYTSSMTKLKEPHRQSPATASATTRESAPQLLPRSALFRATRATLAATGTLALARKMLGLFRPPPAAEVAPPPTADAVAPTSEPIQKPLETPANRASPAIATYDSRIAAEIATFEHDEVVHNLPEIFHYWSNKYLLPMIEPFGFIHPDDFFIKQLAKAMPRDATQPAHFISIGAGNCDTEVRRRDFGELRDVARHLAAADDGFYRGVYAVEDGLVFHSRGYSTAA